MWRHRTFYPTLYCSNDTLRTTTVAMDGSTCHIDEVPHHIALYVKQKVWKYMYFFSLQLQLPADNDFTYNCIFCRFGQFFNFLPAQWKIFILKISKCSNKYITKYLLNFDFKPVLSNITTELQIHTTSFSGKYCTNSNFST